MKFRKTIGLLCLCIIILSLLSCIVGIFSKEGPGPYEIESFRGETIKIYGKGLYKYDSITAVSQGVAQDVVTLILGIPLLIISLLQSLKGSLKARLLLTGTLGYFLYTYISYVFLWMYNPMFLIYVLIMSASFFGFILLMLSFDVNQLSNSFNRKTPVKLLGGFQIFFSVAIFLMWIGRIAPSLKDGSVPVGLDHYTTLVIQGLDLGFIVPVAFISGLLLIKRKPLGYLLSSVVIMKGFTLGVAITAMVIGQFIAGVQMTMVEIIMFPLFSLIICYCLCLLLKNINEVKGKVKS